MTNDNKLNGRKCLVCDKPLIGKQQKYCSNIHRVQYNRAQKKQSSTKTAQNGTDTERNALAITVAKLEGDVARAEAIAVVLGEERDRLQRQLESSVERHKTELSKVQKQHKQQLSDATEARISAESRASEYSGQLSGQKQVQRILLTVAIITALIALALGIILSLSV